MADNQVSLELQVEINKAVATLQQFRQSAEDAMAGAKAANDKLAGAFDSLGKVAAGALAFIGVEKIKEFFSSSIDAAAQSEEQFTRLASAMAATGEYSHEAMDGFKDFAEQMSKTTTVSEDATVKALAMAKAYGISNEQAKELVKVSADYAARFGGDVNDAVDKLGKTFSGSVGRIGKQIPILKSFSEEQLQAGEQLKALEQALGGAAEAQVNTYGGAVKQSQNALEEFKKALGSVFTDSPVMIARVQAFTETLKVMKQWVLDNKDTLIELVDNGIRALAVVIPSALEMLRGFVQILEKVDLAFELAESGAVQLATTLSEGVLVTVQAVGDKFLGLVETLLGAADDVPFLSDALGAMGIDAGSAADSVDKLKKSFDDGLGAGIKGLEGYSDEANQAIQDTVDFTDKVDHALDGIVDGANRAAEAYFKVGDAAKKAFEPQNQTPGPRIADKFDPSAMVGDWEDLYNKIMGMSQTSSEKMESDYAHAMLEIENKYTDLKAHGLADERQFQGAKQALEQHYSDLRDQAAEAEYAKRAAQLKQAVSNAASDPSAFVLHKIGVTPDAFADFRSELSDGMQEGIGAGAGILNSALNGAAGAKQLFQSAAGAFADALIPGLGPVVSQIFGSLEQGPDAVKAQVKAFIAAIPEIMNAIGAAMPAVAEGFVEAFAKKETWVGIGNMVLFTLTGGLTAVLPEIGKEMGVHFGDSLNSPNFSRTVHGWFSGVEETFGKLSSANIAKGFQDGLKGLEALPGKIMDYIFVKFPQVARDAFTAVIADLQRFFTSVPGILTGFFTKVVPQAFTAAFDGVRSFLTAYPQAVISAATQVVDVVKNGLQGLIDGVASAFNSVLDPIRKAFDSFKFPEIPVPSWLQSFIDAVNSASGGASGGAGGAITQGYHKLIGHETGLTEVPGGFPNDSYGPVALTSGERVVDSDTNTDLKRFLAGGAAGGGNAVTASLLSQILEALQQPIQVPVQVKIDGNKMADVILNLKRQNARLA